MKRKLTKAEKFLLIAIALAGSLYVYFSKIYDPKMNDYKNIQTEIVSLEEEILGLGEPPNTKRISDTLNEERHNLQEISNQYSEVLNSRKAITESIGSEVLNEITSHSLASGLKIKEQVFQPPKVETAKPAKNTRSNRNTKEDENNTPEEESGKKHFSWQEYKMVLEGNHLSLIRFIKELKEMHWSTVIEHIEIKAIEETDNFEITMKILI
ncbi:hypothetical protein CACET_c29080 [Clostridium aceticum]|uniref:Uncharacterized protein n=1 Tax=Clostridium aceticum TaxID=84022 RepID=A0A0D8I9I0_9CLOT|nr:hypothetical protein [Clostridium aceticum]AKL96352.1 hypothetical protein CACET_c29080 [Clostridium aceticum]KJF26940.1 hypothetical protein TZ02_10420 [Clostridium aceticum]